MKKRSQNLYHTFFFSGKIQGRDDHHIYCLLSIDTSSFHFSEIVFALTENYEIGKIERKRFNIWNFLFYISMRLSVVFAVMTIGVRPVHFYLIIPSLCAIMLACSNLGAVIIAMLLSFLGNFGGYLELQASRMGS